jgi:hypothetical protein
MFGNRLLLITLVFAFVLPAFAGPAAEEKAVKEASTQKVRLRLLAIETSQLTAHYEGLVKRELELHDAVRSCMKSGDERSHEYEQALLQTKKDLEETKDRLVALEFEKFKLTDGQAKKALEDAAVESTEKLNRTLDAILQRLDKIDKRLEKMEAQKK